jgi:hypothetical protein
LYRGKALLPRRDSRGAPSLVRLKSTEISRSVSGPTQHQTLKENYKKPTRARRKITLGASGRPTKQPYSPDGNYKKPPRSRQARNYPWGGPAKHPCSLNGIFKNPRRSRQAGNHASWSPQITSEASKYQPRSIVTSFVFEGNLQISAGDGGSLSESTSYLSSQAATLLCKQGPACDLERVAALFRA